MKQESSFPVPLSEMLPFAGAGLAWLPIGFALSWHHSPQWMIATWILSVLDLTALAKLMAVVTAAIVTEDVQKRTALAIQALIWGIVKLGCLGLITGAFFEAGSSALRALSIGLGTLIVVPLLGGFIWSQRILHHA